MTPQMLLLWCCLLKTETTYRDHTEIIWNEGCFKPRFCITGPGTNLPNKMNFGMRHVPVAGSQELFTISTNHYHCYGCPQTVQKKFATVGILDGERFPYVLTSELHQQKHITVCLFAYWFDFRISVTHKHHATTADTTLLHAIALLMRLVALYLTTNILCLKEL